MDTSSKVSYRQTGKAANGMVKRGATVGQMSGQEKAFSSIPSKFETTLFNGNKEKDGFNARTHRFHEMDNELPGPGSYVDQGSFVMENPALSKKGLGVGFVSKVKRNTLGYKINVNPGPGQYDSKDFIRKMDDQQRYNTTASTHIFKPPMMPKPSMPLTTPGPGEYPIARHLDTSKSAEGSWAPTAMGAAYADSGHGHKGVFTSATKRLFEERDPVVTQPAPGHYEPRTVEVYTHDQTLPTAAFRSSVQRAPPPKRVTKEELLGVSKAEMKEAPGPGHYAMGTAFKHSNRKSSMFAHTQLDRFGHNQGPVRGPSGVLHVPGPGAYHKEDARATAMISSSNFMSATERINAGLKDPPGPAYYQPDNVNAKSFHLNNVKRWM